MEIASSGQLELLLDKSVFLVRTCFKKKIMDICELPHEC